jgi:hypothetical protein
MSTRHRYYGTISITGIQEETPCVFSCNHAVARVPPLRVSFPWDQRRGNQPRPLLFTNLDPIWKVILRFQRSARQFIGQNRLILDWNWLFCHCSKHQTKTDPWNLTCIRRNPYWNIVKGRKDFHRVSIYRDLQGQLRYHDTSSQCLFQCRVQLNHSRSSWDNML